MTDTPPASLSANLHIHPSQIRLRDHHPKHGDDLVVLRLGDANIDVAVLGTLEEMTAIVQAAVDQLAEAAAARAAREEQP